MVGKEPLVRRTTLIMPADREKFVANAWKRGADAICLDLEDGVSSEQKDAARGMVKGEIAAASRGGADVLVRVNSDWPIQKEDLDASIYPGLCGIILTKVESPEALAMAEEEIARLERERGLPGGSIETTILIESALGYVRASDILRVSCRARTLILGTEDFLRDVGIPQNDGTGLEGARLHMNIMARAYGLEPRGLLGTITDYSNTEGMYCLARRSYLFGYRGATCIHPNQVAPYNRGFSPSEAELEEARAIWDTFQEAAAGRRGTGSLNDKMIDRPVAARAKTLLRYAEAIAQKEKKKLPLEKRED